MSTVKMKKRRDDAAFVRAVVKVLLRQPDLTIPAAAAEALPEGESLPDLRSWVAIGGGNVAKRLDRLRKSEEAYFAARRVLKQRRGDRNEADAQLRAILRRIRDVSRALYQRDSEWLAPPGGWHIPQDRRQLLRVVVRLHRRLTAPELELPQSTLPSLVIEPRELASNLEAPAEELRSALRDVCRLEARLVLARESRNREGAIFDKVIAAALHLLAGAAELSGYPDLAEHVRQRKAPGRRGRKSARA